MDQFVICIELMPRRPSFWMPRQVPWLPVLRKHMNGVPTYLGTARGSEFQLDNALSTELAQNRT